MATYTELYGIRSDSALRNRVTVGCIVAAEAVRNESDQTVNHANRLIWAALVFANPEHEAERMLWAILAQNNAATVAAITGASDATLQTAVNAAVNSPASHSNALRGWRAVGFWRRIISPTVTPNEKTSAGNE